MVVKVLNKAVECRLNTTAWTLGAQYNLTDNNDVVLKQVKFLFSPGCGRYVGIVVKKNGGQILPDPANAYSDAFVGDDILIPVYLSMMCKRGDRIEIFYRNTDKTSAHTVSVIYEIQNLPQTQPTTVITDKKARSDPHHQYNVKTSKGDGVVKTVENAGTRINKDTGGNEFEESFVDGGQIDYSGDWQGQQPSFLRIPKINSYGGSDPRKRGKGRGKE